jgi:hypothetical protein
MVVCALLTAGCAAHSGVAATPAPRPCASGQLTISGAGALSGPLPAEAGHAAGLVAVTNVSSRTCRLSVRPRIEVASQGRHTRLVATPEPAVDKDVGLPPHKRIGFKVTWSTVSGHCVSGARLDVTVPPAETVVPLMARTFCGRQAGYSLLMRPPPDNPKDPGLLPSGAGFR